MVTLFFLQAILWCYFSPLQAIAIYGNRWEVNHKQYKEIKVHIPCQVPNIVSQSKENQGVGYPEWENS